MWTENDVSKVLADPTHCLLGVVSEELWIKTAKRMIRDDGADRFLRLLLQNLREIVQDGSE